MTTLAAFAFSNEASGEPWKMSLPKFSALSLRELSSPNPNRTASIMFVLPLPFGPVMTVKPFSNRMEVGLPKVLKPLSSIFFRLGISC